MKYYVDTSVWMNLFKNEGDDSKGVPYWKSAKDFINKMIFSEDEFIVYSGVILREFQIKMTEWEYRERLKYLEHEPRIMKAEANEQDRAVARKLESKYQFSISFYDLVHIAICKREGFVLVTRDRRQLQVARENGVEAGKPEEL